MKYPSGPPGAGGLPVIARAEFTLDMLQNLVVVFEATAENHLLLVEMCDDAVWAVTPDGHRMFIGATGQPRPLDA